MDERGQDGEDRGGDEHEVTVDLRGPHLARSIWKALEPLHAVTYFSPEPLEALRGAGYRGFWMGYFAGRAAPLGAASAELTGALFYNFDHDHVARALPDAWTFAPPEAALAARLIGSAAALRRIAGPALADGAERLADLLTEIATGAAPGGRALFAANLSLPVPDDPVERLWHAATLLREHRGDGHVATLLAEGVGGREAHVLHSLATRTPLEVYARSRRLTDDENEAILTGMRARALVDDAGRLTSGGHALKRRVERRTDELAWTAYAARPPAELDSLLDALRPLTRSVVASGEIPTPSPMGLDLDAV